MANHPIDPSRDPVCLALLQALSCEHGCAFQVSDIRDARNALATRKRLLPECKDVRVALSPFSPADEIWLLPPRGVPAIEDLAPDGVLL